MKELDRVRERIEARKERSAWGRGVQAYALDMIEIIADCNELPEDVRELKTAVLNGADTWQDASYGGCFLIYDEDIARRLCNNSELKRTRNGERQPNSREIWLDVQARALSQAFRVLWTEYDAAMKF